MPSAVAIDARDAHAHEGMSERVESLPWYVVAMAIGALSVVVGVIWDISWHKTIGRDTFWTPAHMAIYLGGLIGGFGGGYLALTNTFGAAASSVHSTVRFWGFRAPFGAWMTIWGAIAMLTSAPFDDWWHNAYGLDVEILSPPHSVLAMGIISIVIGALILSLAYHNRRIEAGQPSRGVAYLFVAGLLLCTIDILTSEYTLPNEQHQARFYILCAAVFPLLLVATGRAAKLRWATTSIAAVYLGVSYMMIWILPLFEATPMLGPIYNPVDHMVAPHPPLLLIVPAIFIDLVLHRFGDREKGINNCPPRGIKGGRNWLLGFGLGAAFFAAFLVTHWYYSQFMLSSLSDHWLIGGHRFWGYFARAGEWQTRFWGQAMGFQGALIALGAALISARLGLGWGDWMTRVRR